MSEELASKMDDADLVDHDRASDLLTEVQEANERASVDAERAMREWYQQATSQETRPKTIDGFNEARRTLTAGYTLSDSSR